MEICLHQSLVCYHIWTFLLPVLGSFRRGAAFSPICRLPCTSLSSDAVPPTAVEIVVEGKWSTQRQRRILFMPSRVCRKTDEDRSKMFWFYLFIYCHKWITPFKLCFNLQGKRSRMDEWFNWTALNPDDVHAWKYSLSIFFLVQRIVQNGPLACPHRATTEGKLDSSRTGTMLWTF